MSKRAYVILFLAACLAVWLSEYVIDIFLFHGGDLVHNCWVAPHQPYVRAANIAVLVSIMALLLYQREKTASRAAEIGEMANLPDENPFPVLRICETGKLLYANRSGREIMASHGVQPGGQVGGDLRAASDAALRLGEIRELELMYGARVIALSAIPLASQGCVNVYGRDITTEKKTYRRLQQSDKIIANTIEGILVTDTEGIIRMVNPGFTRITGYAADEALGQTPRLLRSQHHAAAFYEEMWRQVKATGQWKGEIWNRRKNGEAYPEYLTISSIKDETGEDIQYIAVFNDITERKQSEEKIKYQAYHDALTGLPNRQLFFDRLEQYLARVQRTEEPAAVLFLDLDRFKNINDTLGHVIGDQLLREVALRLRQCVRAGDTVARQGGDEFIILLENIRKTEHVATVARNIIEQFEQPFTLNRQEMYVTTSIGISIYPEDGTNPEILVKNADAAMYRAKEKGRNNFQLFTEEMYLETMEKLLLENRLRKAIEEGQLQVYYQPRVCLKGGKIIGMEALVRWPDPDFGLVMPGKFIPLAEETGLIVPLGEYVLHEACRQTQVWRAAGLPPCRVSVNLSARQFQQVDLLAMIQGIMAATNLPPASLELEITESSSMSDPEQTVSLLRELKEMGIYLAIDDFGTGYSSMTYLKKFPIDVLKIDRSFVMDVTTDPDDAAIAETIIAMGHSLGFKVLAEGVETEEQLRFIMAKGCDEVQGFLFSKALPAGEFEQLLRKGITWNY